ncbi:hypothetical protein [Brevibacillus migulae]|uniref:hypothetical protein n=1 Tax=Brevibacillus migulae TaxID=1644114 RepID=UPI00106E3F10|nr:hypothetical protein [Brevibacillus migulae]
MSTTELKLKTNLEGRVLRTLQTYFRRSNHVLIRESLWASGMSHEDADFVMPLLTGQHTVSEIMEMLRQKGVFDNQK